MMPSAMPASRPRPTPASPASPTPRAASQAATRERLLQCAERLVVSHSIPGLSLRQLCAEAGFTQGAFYANFASKHALLLEVSERHAAQQHASLAAVAQAVRGRGLGETLGALGGWLRERVAQREWAALAVELQLHAGRDTDFAAVLTAVQARTAQAFAALLDDLAARLGGQPVVPTPAAAQALYALWQALALQAVAPGGGAGAGTGAGAAPERIFLVTLCALLGLPQPKASATPAARKRSARVS